jgi:hypothetical protein
VSSLGRARQQCHAGATGGPYATEVQFLCHGNEVRQLAELHGIPFTHGVEGNLALSPVTG